MITPSEVMQVISRIALVHPKTAPRMDDLEAVRGTAIIWAEMFNRHDLGVPQLIEAVIKRAETERDAPEAAEIIAVAREIRRERAEREDEAARKAREDEWDAELMARNRERLDELINPVADAKAVAPLKYTRPSQRTDGKPNPLAIRCPWCHAAEHRPCRIPNVHGEKSVTLREPHPSRVEAAEAIARKLNDGAA